MLDDLRWAWSTRHEVPYRFSELWTARGRAARYERWIEKRGRDVRAAMTARGLRVPPGWTDRDLWELYGVLVGRIYDVEGFAPRGTTLDLGSQYGDFTLLASLAGRAIAFEPVPENFERTRELLAANGVADRADVQAVAVGGADGSVRMGRNAEHMGSATVLENSVVVAVRSLDSLFPHEDGVSLLKVDIEGMEGAAFRGGQQLIARCRPRIIVEVHGAAADADVTAVLAGYGYVRVASGPRVRDRGFGYRQNQFWAPAPPNR